jgi:hypothetical protein
MPAPRRRPAALLLPLAVVAGAGVLLSRRRAVRVPVVPAPDPQAPALSPAALARPALWPQPHAGAQPHAFDGQADEEPGVRPPPRGRRLRLLWLAVVVMLAGAALVGVGIAVGSWWPIVAGVLVGLVGSVLGLRLGILESVSESD